ncbi:unnamed protein product, partial [Ceratitis capitata]
EIYKKHRLVEFPPQTDGVPNQKLFVRKAEIHIRIERVYKGRTYYKKRKQLRCDERKTKLKLWIFKVVDNNSTEK